MTLRSCALGLALLALASCWAMPLKMLYGEGGSYYTFAVIGDEMIYANRMQALPAGATIQNPLNGVCDPSVISPYLLEDVVRELVTLSGLHIITVFWIWRFAFPILLLGSLYLLAKAALPGRLASWPVVLIAASAIQALYFLVYALIVPYPPMGGWLLRIPTNVEYPLAALCGAAMCRFALSRNPRWGLLSGLALAALLYLRPYSGMPWAMTAFLAMLLMLFRRELQPRTAALVAAALLGSLLPLVFIIVHNGALQSYRETMLRYFEPVEYRVHPGAIAFCVIGLLFAIASRRVQRRFRALLYASAAVMFVLPFISGLPKSMRNELLSFDRYTPFYFTMLGIVPCLVLHRIRVPGRVWTPALACTMLVLAGLTLRHGTYDYSTYYCGHYGALQADLPSLRGYAWLREKTPPDTLVLNDERIHWGTVGATHWSDHLRATWIEDLFQVASHRRPVYHWRMYGSFMTHEQFAELVFLQRATFGMELKDEASADRVYAKLLAWYKPGYVFWRKGSPGLRGRGERLRKIATVEYADDACEIWKLNYPERVMQDPGMALPENLMLPAARPQPEIKEPR